MYEIVPSGKFKKDLKAAIKRGYDMRLIDKESRKGGIFMGNCTKEKHGYVYSSFNIRSDTDWYTDSCYYSINQKKKIIHKNNRPVLRKLSGYFYNY